VTRLVLVTSTLSSSPGMMCSLSSICSLLLLASVGVRADEVRPRDWLYLGDSFPQALSRPTVATMASRHWQRQ
jgi:hypothetical protein